MEAEAIGVEAEAIGVEAESESVDSTVKSMRVLCCMQTNDLSLFFLLKLDSSNHFLLLFVCFLFVFAAFCAFPSVTLVVFFPYSSACVSVVCLHLA